MIREHIEIIKKCSFIQSLIVKCRKIRHYASLYSKNVTTKKIKKRLLELANDIEKAIGHERPQLTTDKVPENSSISIEI